MTYGFIFYWFSWLLWGAVTFFMRKDRVRTILSALLLMSILFSNASFSIGRLHILLPFLFLMIMAGYLYSKALKPRYHMLSSFVLMIGYTAILLWTQTASLWFFFPEYLLLPLLCSILVILLVKDLSNRVIISILGTTSGEVLYGLVLSSYHLPVTIGNLNFFVHLYMILLIIVLLHIIQKREASITPTRKKMMEIQNDL